MYAARKVHEIAGMKSKAMGRLAWWRTVVITVLPRHWKFHERFEELPLLGSCDLQDKDVMCVVVAFESSCVGRRDIEIRLERNAEFAFEVAAQLREGRQAALDLVEYDRDTTPKELCHRQRINATVGEGVIAGIWRLIHSGKPDLWVGEVESSERFVDLVDRQEITIHIGVVSPDDQRLLLPNVREERLRGDRPDQAREARADDVIPQGRHIYCISRGPKTVSDPGAGSRRSRRLLNFVSRCRKALGFGRCCREA